MFEINKCSPIWSYGSQKQLKVTRFIFLTVLLLLYLMYLIINFLMRKSIENYKNEETGQRAYNLETNKKKWDRQYMMMFGDHIVAVGFALCFSPYAFETTLSILYLLLRVVYQISMYKYSQPIKQIKTILRIINLAMLVCAMVGLSRSGYDDNTKDCRDPDYRNSSFT